MSYVNYLEDINSIITTLQKDPYPYQNRKNYQATLEQIKILKDKINELETFIIKQRKIIVKEKKAKKNKSIDNASTQGSEVSSTCDSKTFSTKNISCTSLNSFNSIIEHYNPQQKIEFDDLENELNKFDEQSNSIKSPLYMVSSVIEQSPNKNSINKKSSKKSELRKNSTNENEALSAVPLINNVIINTVVENATNINNNTNENKETNINDVSIINPVVVPVPSKKHSLEKELYDQYSNLTPVIPSSISMIEESEKLSTDNAKVDDKFNDSTHDNNNDNNNNSQNNVTVNVSVNNEFDNSNNNEFDNSNNNEFDNNEFGSPYALYTIPPPVIPLTNDNKKNESISSPHTEGKSKSRLFSKLIKKKDKDDKKKNHSLKSNISSSVSSEDIEKKMEFSMSPLSAQNSENSLSSSLPISLLKDKFISNQTNIIEENAVQSPLTFNKIKKNSIDDVLNDNDNDNDKDKDKENKEDKEKSTSRKKSFKSLLTSSLKNDKSKHSPMNSSQSSVDNSSLSNSVSSLENTVKSEELTTPTTKTKKHSKSFLSKLSSIGSSNNNKDSNNDNYHNNENDNTKNNDNDNDNDDDNNNNNKNVVSPINTEELNENVDKNGLIVGSPSHIIVYEVKPKSVAASHKHFKNEYSSHNNHHSRSHNNHHDGHHNKQSREDDLLLENLSPSSRQKYIGDGIKKISNAISLSAANEYYDNESSGTETDSSAYDSEILNISDDEMPLAKLIKINSYPKTARTEYYIYISKMIEKRMEQKDYNHNRGDTKSLKDFDLTKINKDYIYNEDMYTSKSDDEIDFTSSELTYNMKRSIDNAKNKETPQHLLRTIKSIAVMESPNIIKRRVQALRFNMDYRDEESSSSDGSSDDEETDILKNEEGEEEEEEEEEEGDEMKENNGQFIMDQSDDETKLKKKLQSSSSSVTSSRSSSFANNEYYGMDIPNDDDEENGMDKKKNNNEFDDKLRIFDFDDLDHISNGREEDEEDEEDDEDEFKPIFEKKFNVKNIHDIDGKKKMIKQRNENKNKNEQYHHHHHHHIDVANNNGNNKQSKKIKKTKKKSKSSNNTKKDYSSETPKKRSSIKNEETESKLCSSFKDDVNLQISSSEGKRKQSKNKEIEERIRAASERLSSRSSVDESKYSSYDINDDRYNGVNTITSNNKIKHSSSKNSVSDTTKYDSYNNINNDNNDIYYNYNNNNIINNINNNGMIDSDTYDSYDHKNYDTHDDYTDDKYLHEIYGSPNSYENSNINNINNINSRKKNSKDYIYYDDDDNNKLREDNYRINSGLEIERSYSGDRDEKLVSKRYNKSRDKERELRDKERELWERERELRERERMREREYRDRDRERDRERELRDRERELRDRERELRDRERDLRDREKERAREMYTKYKESSSNRENSSSKSHRESREMGGSSSHRESREMGGSSSHRNSRDISSSVNHRDSRDSREISSSSRKSKRTSLIESGKDQKLNRSSYNDIEKHYKMKMEMASRGDKMKKHSSVPLKQQKPLKDNHKRESYVSSSSDDEDDIPIASILRKRSSMDKIKKYMNKQ